MIPWICAESFQYCIQQYKTVLVPEFIIHVNSISDSEIQFVVCSLSKCYFQLTKFDTNLSFTECTHDHQLGIYFKDIYDYTR